MCVRAELDTFRRLKTWILGRQTKKPTYAVRKEIKQENAFILSFYRGD